MAAMIDVWTVCWRAPVDKHKDRAMIILYQLKTNANARLNNMAASDTPLRDHSVCWNELATGPLGVDILASQFKLHFLEIRNCNLWLLSLSNPTNILFFSAWISELHRN